MGDTSGRHADELRRALRASQAVQCVRLIPTVILAHMLVAGFVAMTFWDRAPRAPLIGLGGVMVLLLSPALVGWQRWKHGASRADATTERHARAVALAVTLGVLWGAAVWWLFPLGGPEERATLVMLMTGLTGGAVAVLSSSPQASIGFFLSVLIPLLIQALRVPVGDSGIVPIALGLFIVGALLITRASWTRFVENVRVLVERDAALAEAQEAERRLQGALSRMHDLAMADELTGLKNRRAFFDDAEPAIAAARRRRQPVAIALLDLDHFKDVNDTHGHAAGDEVLKDVARRITETLREEQIVGRFGGEEFVVLLPETTPAQAKIAIERVRNAVCSAPVRVSSGMFVEITLSGGIAPVRHDAGVEEALNEADRALYRAKGAGRNRTEVSGS